MTLTDQLKEVIRDYGTVYRVAKDSGVPQPVVQRFVTDQRGISLATADRLAEFFGLELRPIRAKRSK